MHGENLRARRESGKSDEVVGLKLENMQDGGSGADDADSGARGAYPRSQRTSTSDGRL